MFFLQTILLFSFFISSIQCSLVNKTQARQDNPLCSELSLRSFLDNPDNKCYINGTQPATRFAHNGSLFLKLIQNKQLRFAEIMIQEYGETGNDTLLFTDETHQKALGSTPLIALAFNNHIDQQNTILRIAQRLIEKNPYLIFQARADRMTPYLAAAVQGNIELMNLFEQTNQALYNKQLGKPNIVFLQQATEENNSAIDLLFFPFCSTRNPEKKEKIFLKIIEIITQIISDPLTYKSELKKASLFLARLTKLMKNPELSLASKNNTGEMIQKYGTTIETLQANAEYRLINQQWYLDEY